MAALLALAAALGWGSSDFAAGAASRRSSAVSVVVLTHLTSAVAMAACLAIGWRGQPTLVDGLWGLAAGVSGGLGAMLLYRGLARGSMAVVAPITAAGAALAPAIWGMVQGEPLTPGGAAGMGLALAAIVLVSAAVPATAPVTTLSSSVALLEPVGRSAPFTPFVIHDREVRLRVEQELLDATSPRRVLPPGVADALLSGLGFGGFYVLVAQVGDGAGLGPLAAARGVSAAMFAVGAVLTGRAVLPVAGTRVSVVWAGLLDAAAAVAFLTAARTGLLSVTAVLSSLYPGVTVLLARMITKEKLVGQQLLGLGCAAAAIALFALG